MAMLARRVLGGATMAVAVLLAAPLAAQHDAKHRTGPPPAERPAHRPGGEANQTRRHLDALARQKAAHDDKAAEPEHGHGKGPEKHGAKHCEGHGPDDPPPGINLYHGFLGLKTDKREEVGWVRRYDNPADPCHKESPPLLAAIVNLLALAFIIYRFGRRPIAEGLRKRKDTIMKEIDEAKAIKDKAHLRLEGYKGDLGHLDDKLRALRDQYAKEAQVEDKRTREELAAARDRMMADADFRISQESKSGRDQLSRQALADALAAAEQLLATTITQRDHDRLAEEYLDQIGAGLQQDGVRAREVRQ